MGTRWIALWAALAVAFAGCEGVDKYRVKLDRNQAAALGDLERRFIGAVETGNTADLSKRIDLDGRMAVLELTEWAALEKKGPHKPSKEMMVVLATVLGGEDVEGAFTTDEVTSAGARVLQEKLAEELDLDAADAAVVGLFLRKLKPPTEEDRRLAVQKKLDETHASKCRDGDIDVGFSSALLDQLPTPNTKSFTTFRSKLQSAQLSSVECEGRHGVLLFTRYKNRPEPLIAAWQFFDDDQWEVLKPKLEKLAQRAP